MSAVAGDDLAVVWIDAHADLNTPESSPSGAFHGMVLRAIVGDGIDPLRLSPGIPPSRIVLAGTRAVDAEEQRFIDEHGIRDIDVVGIATDYCVRASALDALGAGRTVRVLTDLIAGVHPDSSAAALSEIETAGARLIRSA